MNRVKVICVGDKVIMRERSWRYGIIIYYLIFDMEGVRS
jgi:hypothetical protein